MTRSAPEQSQTAPRRIGRAQIVRAARSYVGTRFAMRGRSVEEGFDCVGLLWRVGADLGYVAEDDQSYTNAPSSGHFQRHMRDWTSPASTAHIKHGMIALFRQSVTPLHCGIIAFDRGHMTIINANLRKRQVIEESWDAWRPLLIEVRDYPGAI